MGSQSISSHSYLYCSDHELGWGNRTYFTWFSQFRVYKKGSEGQFTTSNNYWLTSAVESGVLVLLFILSSLTNGTVFYTLCSNRRLRTVTNYLVCNLTLADSCFTLCCPLVAVVRVTGAWTLGSFTCKTVVYFSVVCGFVTIWTLTLISLDRYMCIVRSGKRRITPAVALFLIALVWVLTLVAFTPLLLYFVVKECPYGVDVVSICTLGWPRTPGVMMSAVFTSIICGLGFVVPVVILVFSHAGIFIKIRKVQLAMTSHRQRRFSSSDAGLLASQSVWSLHANHVFTTANATSLTPKWPLPCHLHRTKVVHNLSKNDEDLRTDRLGLLLDPASLVKTDYHCLLQSSFTSARSPTSRSFSIARLDNAAAGKDTVDSLFPVLLRDPNDQSVVTCVKLPCALAATGKDAVISECHCNPYRINFVSDPLEASDISSGTSSTSHSSLQPYRVTSQTATLPHAFSRPVSSTHEKRARRRARTISVATSSLHSHGSGASSFNSLGRQRAKTRELRVVKTLLVLVLLFLVMWAPIFVVLVLLVTDARHNVTGSVSSSAFLLALCLAYTNAVLNPLAYGLSTEKLRRYLHNSILCRCLGNSKRRAPKTAFLAAPTPRGSQGGSAMAACAPDASSSATSRRNSRRCKGAAGREACACSSN